MTSALGWVAWWFQSAWLGMTTARTTMLWMIVLGLEGFVGKRRVNGVVARDQGHTKPPIHVCWFVVRLNLFTNHDPILDQWSQLARDPNTPWEIPFSSCNSKVLVLWAPPPQLWIEILLFWGQGPIQDKLREAKRRKITHLLQLHHWDLAGSHPSTHSTVSLHHQWQFVIDRGSPQLSKSCPCGLR